MDLRDEKKVEYIELIYDLIFVYLIGRNASLLDRVEAGFVSFETLVNYVISSLIVLQIWNYTTLFINRFG
ncbi:MAG: low temperature requirement protein A, partial [Oscillospiraceae bacterium]|nr:low temperature requirement protein A [Oscillospiraceae bacterium]